MSDVRKWFATGKGAHKLLIECKVCGREIVTLDLPTGGAA